MSQKLRRPSLLVGVTGSPELDEGAEVKCNGGGQLLLAPLVARARPLVSDMVLLKPPVKREQIRLSRASHCDSASVPVYPAVASQSLAGEKGESPQ